MQAENRCCFSYWGHKAYITLYCMDFAYLYHTVTHWKHSINEWVQRWVSTIHPCIPILPLPDTAIFHRRIINLHYRPRSTTPAEQNQDLLYFRKRRRVIANNNSGTSVSSVMNCHMCFLLRFTVNATRDLSIDLLQNPLSILRTAVNTKEH